MDKSDQYGYFSDMKIAATPAFTAPSWQLYGEDQLFPDILHVELIRDRAAGLGWVIGAHRHPHLHQFFLISAGSADVLADGHRLQPVPPFVLSIPKGTVHGFTFSSGTDGYVLTVPVTTLMRPLADNIAMAALLDRVVVVPSDAELAEAFQRIHVEHHARHPGRPIMLAALATEIACHAVRRMPLHSSSPNQPTDARLARFLELAEEMRRSKVDVTYFARSVGLSSRHLSRLCLAQLGVSPGDLIEAAKMREASQLLAYTRAPIATIGFAVGFEDPSYFARAFCRHAGVSPRQFRERFEAVDPYDFSVQPKT
jgi:AraC family transcriptional activator of pobA